MATDPAPKQRSLARNLISEAGVIVAAIALANIIFLIYVDVTSAENPYLGIMAYIILPAILVLGIVLFVAGVLVERRKRRRMTPEELSRYPTIDLNVPRTRNIALISAIGGIFFVLVSVLGSYRAYHYTDSDQFCGTLCHTVMKPEFTAYKASPHARVGCVGCHVGPGAGWFVRSKLSGAYQVYSVMFKKYPHPIQSPVKSLRPSRETCEQCHWPEKFFGAQLKVFTHYGYDENNTPRETRMLIKTGGGSPSLGGVVAGIHWHMFNQNQIEYIASDEKRQKIEWVRSRNRKTGETHEFRAADSKMTPQQIAAAPKRVMDCIDCHNRPTHIYVAPDRAIDRAIVAGSIDRSLPYIKAQAVDALAKDYKTTPEAVAGIAKSLRDFYQAKYPAVWSGKRPAVEQAVAVTQQILQTTRFPEMNVDWRTHPDNIGHFYFQGCFRCHDDQHVNAQGKAIAKDCHVCHDILSEAQAGEAMFAPPRQDFQHPVDLGDLRAMNCADCHTGKSM